MLDRKTFFRAVADRPSWLLLPLFEAGFFSFLKDERYLQLQYKMLTGKKLHLHPPKTFNEKIAWLKLNDRKPLYQMLADKYRVRSFIQENLGEEWLIPLLGVWSDEEQVDFETLPEKFVLKCSHGYGGAVICKNKAELNAGEAKSKIRKTLNTEFFGRGKEWAYKDAIPLVIAEKFMDDNGGERPADYKFMCFNGKVKFFCVSRGLGDFSTGSVSFFYPDGSRAPFKREDYPEYEGINILPKSFENMKAAAEKLAAKAHAPFIRVDFYEVAGHPYFSEFTFYPCGGTIFFEPPEYDLVLGKLLQLPKTEMVTE